MKKTVTKAVFPVAGLGTRFLPATKASPKEMLPIVDKPLIQYAVEEAVAAGIDTLVFVTSRTKRTIEDHFDKAYELETELALRGKTDVLQSLQSILPSHVTCVYIRQAEALGLGHAVNCAANVIGDEPFAVILADDMVDDGNRGCMKQMVDIYNEWQCSVLGTEPVDPSETGSYGIVKADPIRPGLAKLNAIVEKPKPEVAPSNQAVVGRYILTPGIFQRLDNVTRGAGGEIQLTDAIALLMNDEPVLSYEFEGKRYDCGSKLGYLTATVEQALKHPEVSDAFRAYLKTLSI
ncbi:MAG: UTP--glucose-1-phosphate uridylyltransferase [Gammaproteobacteria bacterium]|nr:UTP--glucose-1-phosphate uridylyltransferase [Gammaproteobacteria bacterium]NBT43894.1 UTP--glucose-1-phosphate uridylyltransferase [Gammaproteobacteria bacterium]NBY22487.1 UTP--glucose-1-phosphate uridylyltransferase [Gammaproteobacteria bacterium]NDE33762.1 UTP--glucose-1-phosphate uridylyltransferase [Gammaproteobacteria bacterium]NDE55735.1 UTP--glucose-1-phosphate uridylyltransferase [Gammaproteobacteria bacterium]